MSPPNRTHVLKSQKITGLVLLSVLLLAASFQARERTPGGEKRLSSIPVREANNDPHPYPWPESSPEEQGLDSSVLGQMFDQALKLGYVNSVLIVRNGRLVGERYYKGRDRFYTDLIASASKSYLDPLIGIALSRRFLSSLDQKVVDFFPEFRASVQDRRILDITIRHLLQMRAGYPFDPDGDAFNRAINGDNCMKSALLWPLAADPGRTWGYSTLSSHLLSGIITKSTGMSTFDFAKAYLFDPIGVSIQNWDRDRQGYYVGGATMSFSPRDMARFGYFYLSDGVADGLRILPAGWVANSTRKYSDRVTWFQKHFTDFGYGFHWWLARAAGVEVFFALGHGGQNILVAPELQMVIVTTADWNISPQQSGIQINAIFDLILNYLVAPIKALEGPSPYFPADVRGRKMRNSGLAYREYINILSWKPNPRNAAERIVKYKIYKRPGDYLQFLAEVDAGTLEYLERRVGKSALYTYAISALTADGRESVPAYVSTGSPVGW